MDNEVPIRAWKLSRSWVRVQTGFALAAVSVIWVLLLASDVDECLMHMWTDLSRVNTVAYLLAVKSFQSRFFCCRLLFVVDVGVRNFASKCHEVRPGSATDLLGRVDRADSGASYSVVPTIFVRAYRAPAQLCCSVWGTSPLVIVDMLGQELLCSVSVMYWDILVRPVSWIRRHWRVCPVMLPDL